MSTIKDVALRANVSVTTVSRVLNNNGYVHKDTKEIINKAIQELNYAPNVFAESLSRGTTNIIGVVINNITSTTTSKLIEVIELLCQKNGFRTIIAITRNSIHLENYYYELFKKYNIDGFIMGNKIDSIDKFVSLNKPTVSIDFKINDYIPSIVSNRSQGGLLAARELIDNECNNILLIRYINDDECKFNSFVKEITSKNLKLTIVKVEEKLNKESIHTFLSSNKFDGIYTTNDILAIATISQLQKLKIHIPEDCCVIGYDNSPFSTLIYPPLTSVDYPVETLGEKAFNVLYDNIINKTNLSTHEVIDIEIIRRESTIKTQ